MSFYHKYRPQTFQDVIGQDHITITLRHALQDDKVVHAYLFSGSRGTGKTSTARILAKALNCLDPQTEGEPCNKCKNCEATLKGSLVDLIEIDAASNRGIDEIRDLREKIQFSPTQAKRKIYIIDEVHMLTKEAFNAILKTLEEPPAHAYFILATTEAHKIPDTIISRCQQFNFRRLEEQDILKQLQIIAQEEEIKAQDDALLLIAKQVNGGMRDAVSLFEQLSSEDEINYETVRRRLGIVGHQFNETFFELLQNKNAKEAFEALNELNQQGLDLNQFNQEFLFFLREKMIEAINNNSNPGFIILLTNLFSHSKTELRSASIPQLPLEVAICKACYHDEIATKDETASKKSFFSSLGFGSSEKKSSEAKKTQSAKIVPTKKETQKSKPETPPEHLVRENNLEKEAPPPPDTTEQRSADLTFEEIKNEWARVLEKIKTPFIKLSFKDAHPAGFQANIIKVNFKSKFHLDKVNDPKNKVEILHALEETFQTKLALECELNQVESPIEEIKKSDIEEEKSAQENLKDMVQEVFGGF